MRRKLSIFMLSCALAAGTISGCSGSGAASETSAPAVSGSSSGAEAVSSDNGSGREAASDSGSGTGAAPTEQGSSAEAPEANGESAAKAPAADSSSSAEAPAAAEASPVAFEARAMDGSTVTSDIFSQSRLTMVNVWATYCSPCLNEMPDLGELAQEYDTEDFQIIGIVSDVLDGSDDGSADYAAKLISQTGAAYPHLLLNESLYYALLSDVMAVPTTFFFDQDGNLLDTVVGSQDKAAWKEDIDGLLQNQ